MKSPKYLWLKLILGLLILPFICMVYAIKIIWGSGSETYTYYIDEAELYFDLYIPLQRVNYDIIIYKDKKDLALGNYNVLRVDNPHESGGEEIIFDLVNKDTIFFEESYVNVIKESFCKFKHIEYGDKNYFEKEEILEKYRTRHLFKSDYVELGINSVYRSANLFSSDSLKYSKLVPIEVKRSWSGPKK